MPWRRDDALPLLVACLLLLPIVVCFPALPIDETRYLAVAWEMRQSGEFLVPHLNAALYSQKPPLLFWLINAGWTLTGVHAWTGRAVILLCSLASLLLMHRLAWRLTASLQVAQRATWLLLGTIYFALFATAIMFDVLLTTCVLAALLGICDLVDGRSGRGVWITGIAIGLGILAKGPVMLLDIACVALLAPWWSGGRLAGRQGRYFGAFGLAVLLGAAIALAWAIPAAIHGGEEYARAIFLNQTFDRINGVKGTSAHRRPWWWYLGVFPLMVLPWPLVVRNGPARLRALLDMPALRFALAWLLPTLLAFSLVSGKQPHYLLPLIPALALALAVGLQASALRIRNGMFGAVLLLSGVAAASVSHWPLSQADQVFLGAVSPLWGLAIAALGGVLIVRRRQWQHPAVPAVATILLTLTFTLAFLQGPGGRYDITPMAQRIADLQAAGHVVAHLGWHHGVYEFAGRLRDPLPTFETLPEFQAWAREHPDAYVATYFRRFRFAAKPVFTQPFRGEEASLWKVTDALASGVDPKVSHAGEPIEEYGDD